MFKLLIADDEGIVLEKFKMIIKKNFGKICLVETAKTGREVIQKAQEIQPDIVITDIQMPGINGMDAIEEIKKNNHTAHFIIMSAYDKFDYAKRGIDLGVLDFITKPANPTKIVEILEKAMKIVDDKAKKREDELKNKEKLETVIPIIESSMIYTILFQEDYSFEVVHYKQLLDIEEEFGYIFVIEFGEERLNGELTNPLGMTVKAQKFYSDLRELVKEFFHCIVGPVMANRIAVYIPYKSSLLDYNERVKIIERAGTLNRKFSKRMDAVFKIGIGSVKNMSEIYVSYKEANQALKNNTRGSVAHIHDFISLQKMDQKYPMELEHNFIQMLKKRNPTGVMKEGIHFFDWTVTSYGEYFQEIKLKILEIVMYAERLLYESGYMPYTFHERAFYLPKVQDIDTYEDLKIWFLEKLQKICDYMLIASEKQYSKVIERAKHFIDHHYQSEISLDEVSKHVNISPYYFSRIFKEETGKKFIEYLTEVRIECAKKLLRNPNCSIKEVCLSSGYSDPNYFSRIFKKTAGITPTEYREQYSYKRMDIALF